jgi:hypothetical protein
MRAVVIVTDSEAVRSFERAFLQRGVGFTVVPNAWGGGRRGLRAGDRVHPGGCSVVFSVVDDDRLESTLELVAGVRDEAAAECTHVYVAPVEQVA